MGWCQFCERCISDVERCPTCKIVGLKVFCDRVSGRRIKQLRLSCENEEKGCCWSGSLGQYDAHIAECGFVTVGCPNDGCTEKILRSGLEEHLTGFCVRRLLDCTLCKEKIASEDIPTHCQERCPKVEVTCDNTGCSVKVFRCDLADHREVCKKAVINCPFSDFGCDIVVIRNDLPKHLREYSEWHATKSTNAIASLETELKSARNELDSKTIPLLVFKMDAYRSRKSSILFASWDSPYFYSHPGGYLMKIRVVPCGGVENNHLSLFVHFVLGCNNDELMWPFDGISSYRINP